MPRSIALGLAAISCLAAACASGRAVPRPFPGAAPPPNARAADPSPPELPRPSPPSPIAASPDLAAAAPDVVLSLPLPVLTTALTLKGVPYRNGGIDPSGFDCSGFVRYVFAQHGRLLPREVRDQFRTGTAIDRDAVQPGDLVFFETVSRGASHVGIALGGDEFVHAPSSRGAVRVERYTVEYWATRWVGARRVM